MRPFVRGALAIFGVRSVDGEIVHMVDSLESMGQIMVEAQVRNRP